MEKKHRSPSFPQMGLKDAVERVATLYKAIGKHATTREVVAKGLGYSGISGPSATVMGTLTRYGLLEGRGDEIRVSEIAIAILHPHSEQERRAAIRTAASSPELFRELGEKFTGSAPGNELLRNYLIRKNFSEQSAAIAILAYKETLEFAGESIPHYDSASNSEKEADAMDHHRVVQESKKPATPPLPSQPGEGEIVATYGNKDRGFVYIKATHGLSAKEAMAMAKRAIKSFEDEESELAQSTKNENT